MGLLGFGKSNEAAAPAGQPGPDVIKDGSLATFQADVIDASMNGPVLVDFWAPWCGPCKQLTPVLEKQVRAAGGKARLVKINIDENQDLARQMQVQSVPTVFVFLHGQPVTGFQGAQPESQIKMLLEKLTGGPLGADPLTAGIEQAKEAFAIGDIDTAASIFGAVMENEPENTEAIAGLARCLIGMGELDEAGSLLDRAPAEKANDAAISGARASLKLARDAGKVGDVNQLKAALDAAPDDHGIRAELSTALFLRGEIEAAMEHLCHIVKTDREWNDDGARRQLLTLFEALGPSHAATMKGRRMLSSVLFS